MPRFKSNPKVIVVLIFGSVLGGALLYGCKSNQPPTTAQKVAPDPEPHFALFGPAPKKTGVQLWSDNCVRCHNSQPPERFSDAQWDAIVHHMRLRANLTGEEQREIVKFLKASN